MCRYNITSGLSLLVALLSVSIGVAISSWGCGSSSEEIRTPVAPTATAPAKLPCAALRQVTSMDPVVLRKELGLPDVPLVITAGTVYHCPCGKGSKLGGDTEAARLGGDTEKARLGGDQEEARLGGATEAARLGGDKEEARLGGDQEEARVGGATEDARLGGDQEDARLGGATEDARLGGDQEDARLGGATEDARLGGDQEDARLGGATEDARLGGDQEEARLGGDKEILTCTGSSTQFGFSLSGLSAMKDVFIYESGLLYRVDAGEMADHAE